MLICNTKTVKFFLSGIFSLVVSVSSHAMEGRFFYENAAIVGKEYLVVGNASENKDILQKQNSQSEIFSGDSSSIFIAKNAKIYDKEHLLVKQKTQQTFAKTGSKTKTKTLEPVKNNIAEKESREIVVPNFPLDSSSLFYSFINKESAVPVSQQRLHEYPALCKVSRKNIFPDIENSNLSFVPEQRQKFSTAATQCGILTSFSPNSPSL